MYAMIGSECMRLSVSVSAATSLSAATTTRPPGPPTVRCKNFTLSPLIHGYSFLPRPAPLLPWLFTRPAPAPPTHQPHPRHNNYHTAEQGDKPRPLPELAELKGKADGVKDLFERPKAAKPAWDYDAAAGVRRRPPPLLLLSLPRLCFQLSPVCAPASGGRA